MVDVQRAQLQARVLANVGEEIEQDDGIEPAREPHAHRGARRDERGYTRPDGLTRRVP